MEADKLELRLGDVPLDGPNPNSEGSAPIELWEQYIAILSDPSLLLYTASQTRSSEGWLQLRYFQRIGNSKTMPFAPRDD
jgi:hypothetical protein